VFYLYEQLRARPALRATAKALLQLDFPALRIDFVSKKYKLVGR
jgi:hypothetical protein